MLSTVYEHQVDAQKRVTIPSQFRTNFEKEVCVIPSPDADAPCLYVYSEPEWQKVCEQVQAKAVDARSRRIQRRLNSSVTYADLDKAGRLTLTHEQLEFAAIDGTVVLVKNTSHVEIWSKDNWQKEVAAMDALDDTELGINF